MHLSFAVISMCTSLTRPLKCVEDDAWFAWVITLKTGFLELQFWNTQIYFFNRISQKEKGEKHHGAYARLRVLDLMVN